MAGATGPPGPFGFFFPSSSSFSFFFLFFSFLFFFFVCLTRSTTSVNGSQRIGLGFTEFYRVFFDQLPIRLVSMDHHRFYRVLPSFL